MTWKRLPMTRLVEERPAWPVGHYGVILMDPPWKYQNWTDKANGAARAHYQTMGVPELEALPVNSLAQRGTALLLWTTHPKLEEAIHLMRHWGFDFKTTAFVWNKTYASGAPYCGLGFYTRSGSELCLLGVYRGESRRRLNADVRQVITAPVGRHSAKPAVQYERIERLFAGPYIELFARERRPGWTAWGDQLPTETT